MPISNTSISSKLTRLAWTVRYLKAGQIISRVHHRLWAQLENGRMVHVQSVPAWPGCAWMRDVQFLTPSVQDNSAHTIRKGTMRFLNDTVDIGFPPQWDCLQLSKLWQYNLHYFEWLWVLDYEDAKAVVLDWIEKHRLSKDAIGWEPYPISLRLINWCAVFWGKFRENTENDKLFLKELWASICQQSEWLMRHLETHLLGNHYFENGAALAFIGSCFRGELALKWFDCGCRILQKQIPEQILLDGMHFELSPMYHCRMTYLMATLAATGNNQLKTLIAEPLRRMVGALDCICHPDGMVALLNDSAFGIYNEPRELRSFCRQVLDGDNDISGPSSGCFALRDAGYYGWRDQNRNYVICDFGNIGPDYIPGHAHADMFNFELSLKGHRVIVDTGVYDYGASETRQYCRSTAAHNTVEVNGQDQCEMWGAFRIARRGYPQDVQWEPFEKGFSISGWHNGYRRLRGKPIHHRRFEWHAELGLSVTDRVDSSHQIRVVSRLHLHPICMVTIVHGGRVEVSYPDGRLEIAGSDGSSIRVEDGWYFPEFGIKERNKVISFERTGEHVEMDYRIRNII